MRCEIHDERLYGFLEATRNMPAKERLKTERRMEVYLGTHELRDLAIYGGKVCGIVKDDLPFLITPAEVLSCEYMIVAGNVENADDGNISFFETVKEDRVESSFLYEHVLGRLRDMTRTITDRPDLIIPSLTVQLQADSPNSSRKKVTLGGAGEISGVSIVFYAAIRT